MIFSFSIQSHDSSMDEDDGDLISVENITRQKHQSAQIAFLWVNIFVNDWKIIIKFKDDLLKLGNWITVRHCCFLRETLECSY